MLSTGTRNTVTTLVAATIALLRGCEGLVSLNKALQLEEIKEYRSKSKNSEDTWAYDTNENDEQCIEKKKLNLTQL